MMGVLALRFLSGCGLVGRVFDGQFCQFCLVYNLLLSYLIRNKMFVCSAPTVINMTKCAKYCVCLLLRMWLAYWRVFVCPSPDLPNGDKS